jgi:hypothetical protein
MSSKNKKQMIEGIYQSLIMDASTRTQVALEKIKKVCDELVKKGRYNFTIAKVARELADVDGPSEKTIRNKTKSGKVYKALIEAFRAAYQDNSAIKLSDNDVERYIEGIDDHKVRFNMMTLIAENRKLRGELKQQKAAMNATRLADMNGNSLLHNERKSQLDDFEHKALSKFISDTNLMEHGLSINKQSQILTQDGKAITPRGFVDTIQRLIHLPIVTDTK